MARSSTAVSSCGYAPCPVSIRVWMHAAKRQERQPLCTRAYWWHGSCKCKCECRLTGGTAVVDA
mgnify:CR=1 FL=1